MQSMKLSEAAAMESCRARMKSKFAALGASSRLTTCSHCPLTKAVLSTAIYSVALKKCRR